MPSNSRQPVAPDDGVIFLTHTTQPGGGELSLVRYLNSTSTRGHELVTLEDGPLWDTLDAEAVKITKLVRGKWGLLGKIVDVWRLQRANVGRIIVANTMRVALLAAIVKPRRGRLVYWVRDGVTVSNMGRMKLALTRFVTFRRVTSCLANSRWTERSVAAVAPNVPVQVVLSPSGIDSHVATEAKNLDPGRIKILFLGRLTHWKGPDLAVEIAEMLAARRPDVQYSLSIAGDDLFGEEEFHSRLQQQVAAASVPVTLLGHVADVWGLFEEHDVLLHCSRIPEPFGQVVVQALAAGLVVAATDFGGPVEIIGDDGSGFLYAPEHLEPLCAALEDVTSDIEAFRAMSARAIERSRQFTDEVAVAGIDRALDLAKERSRTSVAASR